MKMYFISNGHNNTKFVVQSKATKNWRTKSYEAELLKDQQICTMQSLRYLKLFVLILSIISLNYLAACNATPFLYFQIQFTCALILGINGIRTGCEFPLWMHYMLIIYMMSFIVLFGNFYVKAYMEKVLCSEMCSVKLKRWWFRVNRCSSVWTWVVDKETLMRYKTEWQEKMATCNKTAIRSTNKIGRFVHRRYVVIWAR